MFPYVQWVSPNHHQYGRNVTEFPAEGNGEEEGQSAAHDVVDCWSGGEGVTGCDNLLYIFKRRNRDYYRILK